MEQVKFYRGTQAELDHAMLEQKIEKSLGRIRPYINADGGDVHFVAFDESTGVCMVSFSGSCVGCGLLDQTVNLGVAETLKEDVPEVKQVRISY